TFGRISNSAPWTFNGGTLNFLAAQGTNVAPLASSEIIGPVTLQSGQATIQSGWGAAPATASTSTLTIASLTRSPGATVIFNGNNGDFGTAAGANQILFATAPTLPTGAPGSGILPYALVTSTGTPLADFATVAASSPFNLLRFNNYTTGGINAA